ncbi:MAG: cache domain-containing protein [Magnetococcales bacterium]|nr:cache domain-containing protein [Magnetococcales bacterium]
MTGSAGLRSGFLAWSLRARLIFWSSLLFLAMLCCIVYGIIWGVPHTRFDGRVGQLRAETFRRLGLIANLHKEQIEIWLEDKQKDVRVIARTPALRDLLFQAGTVSIRDDIRQYLHMVIRVYPEFDFAELFDLNRETILSSRDARARPIEWDEFVRRSLLSGKGYLGRAKIIEPERGPVFRIGHPVAGSDGRVAALLVVALNPNRLLHQLLHAGESLGDSGEVLLINDERVFINPPRYPLPGGTRSKPLEQSVASRLSILATSGHEGMIETLDYRDEPVMAAFRHLRLSPEWGLGLVVKIDRRELLAPVRQEVITVLWTALSALLLIGVAEHLHRPQANRPTQDSRPHRRPSLRT